MDEAYLMSFRLLPPPNGWATSLTVFGLRNSNLVVILVVIRPQVRWIFHDFLGGHVATWLSMRWWLSWMISMTLVILWEAWTWYFWYGFQEEWYLKTIAIFRPISLFEILYKLLTKILANRLRKLIAEVMFHLQNAFYGRDVDLWCHSY